MVRGIAKICIPFRLEAKALQKVLKINLKYYENKYDNDEIKMEDFFLQTNI